MKDLTGRRDAVVGRARGRDDVGLAATELAVIMPVVMAFILLMFQISLYWHAANTVEMAADQGVDAGQIEGGTSGDAQAAANWILSQTGAVRDVSTTANRSPDLVTVTVTGRAPRVFPFGNWGVTSTAAGPVERFVPADERGAP